MQDKQARVGLTRGEERRQNVRRALELVRADLLPKLRDQVLLKPNFLTSQNQLPASHVDAIRGVLDFLLTVPNPPREVIIAEGGEEPTQEAFTNFGYRGLAQEYPFAIRLVDLHEEDQWVETPIILADRTPTTVRMPKTVLAAPCKISVAVAKTHDVCVVTLALKNMIMGTLYKPDRVKMHGFQSHAQRQLPAEAQILNINLIRLAQYLSPDIAVIDGLRGLQGDGPAGSDAVENFGIAAASADVYAADAVVAKAMGFEPLDLGLLYYANRLGLGVADLAQIEVLETEIASVQRNFKPHRTTELQLQWQEPNALQYLAGLSE